MKCDPGVQSGYVGLVSRGVWGNRSVAAIWCGMWGWCLERWSVFGDSAAVFWGVCGPFRYVFASIMLFPAKHDICGKPFRI